jgi:hypothetical protein
MFYANTIIAAQRALSLHHHTDSDITDRLRPRIEAKASGSSESSNWLAWVGGAKDATMVAGQSLSDAPTMVQQDVPVEDEFPDPCPASQAPRPFAAVKESL